MRIERSEFITAFSGSMGIEAAEKLIKEVTMQLNLGYSTSFEKKDAIQICEILKSRSGFIGLIGTILLARILVR